MMYHQNIFSFLVALVSARVATAKLRGVDSNTFDILKRRVISPVVRSDIRGKTLRELGANEVTVQKGEEITEKKGANKSRSGKSRSLQSGRALQFFTVYDEFGPSIVNLGETAGLNGLIYDINSFATGQLVEDDVIGALKATCSVIGTNNEHLCTFELLLAEGEDGETFGSVISSGSVEYKPGSGGYLIVEAVGDAYAQFRGGVLTLEYESIGELTIAKMELTLA